MLYIMPGSIRVLVLEAVDLPEAIGDDEEVAIKVAVGTREFQTEPKKTFGGQTAPWTVDFVFPVLNLRDNLLVILLDKTGEKISQNEIDTPSIVERGSFELNLLLNGGGNIHLGLSFVLTDEERRRIDVMRAAALKRRETLRSTSNSQQLAEKEIESTFQQPDEPQANQPDDKLQSIHRKPSTGFEPGEEMDSQEPGAESLDKSAELDNANTSPNIVKAKIKAFEMPRPRGAVKQDIELPSTAKASVSNPELRTYVETGMEQPVSPKEHHGKVDTQITEDVNSDSGYQTGSLEPDKSFSETNMSALGPSEAVSNQNEKAGLRKREAKGVRSNLEPSTKTDRVKMREADTRHKKSSAKGSKRKKRQFNLDSISKQVLNGAIVGVISGVLLIAAGALLWGRDPNKRNRRSTRTYRQISYQGSMN